MSVVHQPTARLCCPRACVAPVRPPEHRDDDLRRRVRRDDAVLRGACGSVRRSLLIGPPLHNLALSFAGMRVIGAPVGYDVLTTASSTSTCTCACGSHAPPGDRGCCAPDSDGAASGSTSGPRRTDALRRCGACCRRCPRTTTSPGSRTGSATTVTCTAPTPSCSTTTARPATPPATAGPPARACRPAPPRRSSSWPFPFGPQGFLHLGFWDSNYGQLGGYDHARWLFLGERQLSSTPTSTSCARRRDGSSVFDHLERSRTGVLRYHGEWVVATGPRPSGPQWSAPRHRDFSDTVTPRPTWRGGALQWDDLCPTKWVVDPRRCPPGAQWHIHRVKRWTARLPVTSRRQLPALPPALHQLEVRARGRRERSTRAATGTTPTSARRSARVDWER